jgi:serine phosphatase RsbU (regulator of sigma subunit)
MISQVPLFADLPPAELDTLASCFTSKTYPAQTILFLEGESGDTLQIIIEGQIEILKAIDTPNEQCLGIRKKGEFIGEMSLLSREGLRTASVRTLTEAHMLELTRADFHGLLTRVPTIAYEMLCVLTERMNESQNIAIHNLMEKNRELTQAYNELQAAQEQVIEKKILDRELLQAREIQQNMLPDSLPHLPDLDLGARMIPARMIGGDFFDVIQLDPDCIGLAVGDVSGKGIPAALFMALTMRLLQAEASTGSSPEIVLRRVNQHLLAMNIQRMFVTVLYGFYIRSKHQFIYARAGHEYPLVWDESGRLRHIEESDGNPLGLFQNPIVELQGITLHEGDTLLLFSDGAIDAMNEQEAFFGIECLKGAVPKIQANSAQDICDQLIEKVQCHCGNMQQYDDLTLLSLKLIS